jgi:hypothetical protein
MDSKVYERCQIRREPSVNLSWRGFIEAECSLGYHTFLEAPKVIRNKRGQQVVRNMRTN